MLVRFSFKVWLLHFFYQPQKYEKEGKRALFFLEKQREMLYF